MKYRITQGGSILGRDNKRYTAGMIVADGFFKNQKSHIATGYLTPVNDSATPEPSRPTETVPGREIPIVLKGDAKDESSKVITLTTDHTPSGEPVLTSTQANPNGAPVKQETSPWTISPESLVGKNLEELNVMIHERDDMIPPFDDISEAQSLLTSGYEAPAK